MTCLRTVYGAGSRCSKPGSLTPYSMKEAVSAQWSQAGSVMGAEEVASMTAVVRDEVLACERG